MAAEPVHPLRLSKSASPSKLRMGGRPLSEISPSEKRRNSPSWVQTSKKLGLSTDSSPFQSSPFDGTSSPRMFWQNKNENSLSERAGSPSPTRRSSIERLQKASRVKNSNILALEHKQEYDPTKLPQIERPLAKVQGNAFGGSGLSGYRDNKARGHQRSETLTDIPIYDPAKPPSASQANTASLRGSRPPSRDQVSPTKSALAGSRFKNSFDKEFSASISSETSFDDRQLPDGKSLHRYAKSVTFDNATPQIHEYEEATPAPSSVATDSRQGSYDSTMDDEDEDDEHYATAMDGGVDESFDASLEDTDKTPVMGPDDYTHESPIAHRDHMMADAQHFEGSPMPEAAGPAVSSENRFQPGRSESATSNGEHRPLPPLPGAGRPRAHSSSSQGLSATADRMLGSQRSLPTPPPASASKSEIQSIGNHQMTLEERLKLLMSSDDGKSAAESQRERRMRRAGARDIANSQTPEPDSRASTVERQIAADEKAEEAEGDDTLGDLSGFDDFAMPAPISRESIMRRVQGNKAFERESDYRFSSPVASSPARQLPLDPDVPIPSTEDGMYDEHEAVEVSPISEPVRDVTEEISEMYHQSPSPMAQSDSAGTLKAGKDDDSVSHYSTPEVVATTKTVETKTAIVAQDDDVLTKFTESKLTTHKLVLPSSDNYDFSLDLPSFMLPKAQERAQEKKLSISLDAQAKQRPRTPPQLISKPEYDGSGWGEPDEFEDEQVPDPGTPDSVIHHPVSEDEEEVVVDSPVIPDTVATIKSASGSKLKTRPSATPADLEAMRDARRHVSREAPRVPPIPERHRNRLSRDMTNEPIPEDDFVGRHPSFKNRSLTLDLDSGLTLGQDLERVIEAQKVANPQSYSQSPSDAESSLSRTETTDPDNVNVPRLDETNTTPRKQRGYLMRQNTKVVTASDKETQEDHRSAIRSAGNSPVKATRPQSWTVEPWNGQTRKRSAKFQRRPVPGAVPPMPGQESNTVVPRTSVEEEASVDANIEEAGERGRLFVKVMGVKDLDLPLPRNERSWFSLTLDNGVHCVTTTWLELARNAPIGQEFELVVPNDLEFQLTLNVKLEKPAAPRLPQSPTKMSKTKTSTFSRVFASPKKRREMEMRQKEEEERQAQQQREAHARSVAANPTAWDLLSPLAAEDGSFARAYICLKEHETRCFGRPYIVDVACFNEWATEDANFASSVKSKRGSTAIVRKAPYKIGKLELQLLFVPRPKGATDDDMPKSMNSCIREMKAAEERLSKNWEGHLSQQGGDCPYWRRRFFRLAGNKLTAYHEATRQPRATINLANAKRLIDDRRTLTEKETLGKGGKRRRSAFAEEEEGYMFVEEGFRIRFNNGEVIDFYADTAADKEGWMRILADVIGRDSLGSDTGGLPGARVQKGKWCDVVLKREDTLRRRAEGRAAAHNRTKSALH